MLVDNGVLGDSRVQKVARSAAEAGWEAVLLGVVKDASAPRTWRIGGAEVRLLAVGGRLEHPTRLRRSLLRRPLAYPPTWAAYRVLRARVRRADVDERRTAAALAPRRSRLTSLRLDLALLAARVAGRWARFRNRELARLRARQQDPRSPVTRMSIWYWRTLMGDRSWRRLHPHLWEYELAFGPVIDELRPDLIHAHDFRMVGVGVRAAQRARARGRDVKCVWDAHEFVGGVAGRADDIRWLPAQIAHVNEYARQADAVVTVSETLADLLQSAHRLPRRPRVVLNAPVTVAPSDPAEPVPDLRRLCGVGPDTPLLVYSGGLNPQRGVDIMVEALPRLPGTHVALVSVHPTGSTDAVDALRARAAELGVGDRLHPVPYVPHWQVPSFLSTADAGVMPIHRQHNYELALLTKFFEYAHARLPMVVSDIRTVAETTREVGQGEVFRAKDLDDYVRAVSAVLSDPGRYRAAYDRPGLLDGWTWEAQARVLDDVYRELLPDRRRESIEAASGGARRSGDW
jgi:glycosyltransferase involved in cell wall biosynthesis